MLKPRSTSVYRLPLKLTGGKLDGWTGRRTGGPKQLCLPRSTSLVHNAKSQEASLIYLRCHIILPRATEPCLLPTYYYQVGREQGSRRGSVAVGSLTLQTLFSRPPTTIEAVVYFSAAAYLTMTLHWMQLNITQTCRKAVPFSCPRIRFPYAPLGRYEKYHA